MQLDAVRELKAALLERSWPARADAVAARRMAEVTPVWPGLSLGIHRVRRGDFRLAVRVQDHAAAAAVEDIRAAARGEVDVRHVGRIAKRQWYRERQRPLLIGVSLGHRDVSAGTLGSFVRGDDGAPRLLSNNHVLADENRAEPGDPIVQPGRFDGGRDPGDRIGALDRFVPLIADRANLVDAAVAGILAEVPFEPALLRGVGTLAADPLAPEDAGAVEKLGRTTGRTRGRVTAFALDGVAVAYDTVDLLRFDDQVEIHGDGAAFSAGGDSGALIFSADDHRPVALLFAGNEEGVTYGNPISTALEALDLTLLASAP